MILENLKDVLVAAQFDRARLMVGNISWLWERSLQDITNKKKFNVQEHVIQHVKMFLPPLPPPKDHCRQVILADPSNIQN